MVPVRDRRLDLLLEVALADVEGAGQVALLPLGVFADVDDGGVAALADDGDLGRTHLADLRAGLAQEVGVGLGHGVEGLRVSTGWLPFGARADGTKDEAGFAGVRPARYTCSGP